MAIIRKRRGTYQIRVSLGYDKNGNHKEQAMTWRPDESMSERQIQKELNRQAVMFEEACMHGYKASALISAGLDVTTVSGALGHSNYVTTLNVYCHQFQNAQARVAEAMDGAFGFLDGRKLEA